MATSTPAQRAVAQLYTALFNRAPDADGFAFWVQAVENGAAPAGIAQSMLTAPESQALYPAGQSSAQFVIAYYTSVFGRAPDPGGLAFWSAALDAQGGAGNAAAKASLVQQISTIASTPLGTKPEDMSDADYAQTVADRARFTNKTEFGVYFATELKSNDLTLAATSFALVTSDPASLIGARDFAANGGIVPNPIPTLNLTKADSAADISTKIAAYPGTAATVNADGMDAAQLSAVSAGVGKIAARGISSLSLALADVDDTVTANLLPKAGDARVVGTGATVAELGSLVGNLANVAAGGITGTLAITKAVGGNDLPTLLAKYAGTAVTADVTGMTQAQLVALQAANGKIAAGGITGTLDLGAAAITGALLPKGSDLNVVVTGADALQLGALATNLAGVAANGITGDLAIPAGFAGTNISALFGKYAGTTATVDALGMGPAQWVAVAAAVTAGKVADGGITSLTLVLSTSDDATTAALLSKASGATVVAGEGTSVEIQTLLTRLDRVAADGITGDLPVNSGISAADITRLLTKYAGSTATVDATGMQPDQLSAVAQRIDRVGAGKISGGVVMSNLNTAAELAALLSKFDPNSGLQVSAFGMDSAQLAAVGLGLLGGPMQTVQSLQSLTLGDAHITDAVTSNLLARLTGTSATVIATGASTSELDALAQHINKIAVGGITGTVALTSAQTATQLQTLTGAKVGDATATVTVDAAGMDATQVAAVSVNMAKVDTLVGLPKLLLGDAAITDAVTASLLSKATDVKVTATGASAAEVATLLANAAKVAAGGIDGTLTLGIADLASPNGAALASKLAVGASLTVLGTPSRDIIDLSGLTQGARVEGGGGADRIVLGGGADTVFVASRDAARNAPSANDTDTSNILTIANLRPQDVIRFSSAADAFGNGIALQAGAIAPVNVVTNAVDIVRLGQVVDIVNNLIPHLSIDPASTSAAPKIFTVNSYTYNNGVTPGALANKTFFILNDDNPAITLDDTIIAVENYINTIGGSQAKFEAGF